MAASAQPGNGAVSGKGQLCCWQFNARSVLNKRAELKQIVLERGAEGPDILAVTESWLNAQVPDSSLVLPGFNTIFRADHKLSQRGCRGGGVLVSTKDGLRCTRCPDLELWSESFWIEVQLSWGRSLVWDVSIDHRQHLWRISTTSGVVWN